MYVYHGRTVRVSCLQAASINWPLPPSTKLPSELSLSAFGYRSILFTVLLCERVMRTRSVFLHSSSPSVFRPLFLVSELTRRRFPRKTDTFTVENGL